MLCATGQALYVRGGSAKSCHVQSAAGVRAYRLTHMLSRQIATCSCDLRWHLLMRCRSCVKLLGASKHLPLGVNIFRPHCMCGPAAAV